LVRLVDASSADASELHRVRCAADLVGKLAAAVQDLEASAAGHSAGGTLPTG